MRCNHNVRKHYARRFGGYNGWKAPAKQERRRCLRAAERRACDALRHGADPDDVSWPLPLEVSDRWSWD